MKDARALIKEYELEKLIDEEAINKAAIMRTEQSGIVFLDEIDKLARDQGASGGYSSGPKGEGVQKELLSLIEGTNVQTKWGTVNTDHVLFIAAGAFHQSKPSDLLPELQGRLPIRVSLDALTQNDFVRILTETEANLIEQQKQLLDTEGVTLEFDDKAIEEIARLSAELNRSVENIGARRLRAIVAKVLEDVSYDADERKGETFKIDEAFVRKQVGEIAADVDISRYIL